MQTKPHLSIIIPTYNAAQTLTTCLNSIFCQSYKDYEVLIIDGKSTDSTLEIIDQFKTNLGYWVSEKDNGIYDAINKGIGIARGNWVYVLGSDDVLYNDTALATVATHLNSAIDILYGNVIFKHSGKKWRGKFDLWILNQMNICHQAIFFKKNVFAMLGLYNGKYSALADWEFNFRWIANRSIKNKYINEIMAIYNEQGFSSRKIDQAFVDDRDAIQKTAYEQACASEKMFYRLASMRYRGFCFWLYMTGTIHKVIRTILGHGKRTKETK